MAEPEDPNAGAPEDVPPEEQYEEWPEPEPGEDPEHPTRQEAQLRHLLLAFGRDEHGQGVLARGPWNWREVGTRFLYREHRLIVRDEYLAQVREILGDTAIEEPLVQGVTQISFPYPAHEALQRISGVRLRAAEEGQEAAADGATLGSGVAAYDYLLTITGGTGGWCPANEPIPTPPGVAPYPGLAADPGAGEGIRVVIVDTGVDRGAQYTHRWLTGVDGDPDPAINPPDLGPYAGHGTFVAGVVRCLAPAAEVIVRRPFHKAGATFETDLVRALDRVLEEDYPDVISMSAGTYTFDPTALLGLGVFHETRLRHHKGVVLVAAAGNDGTRQPFWPAAYPWTVSVGALARDRRRRADFSNYGRWVDAFAPGEDLVNAYPVGTYTYQEPSLPGEPPHQPGDRADFSGMARWSGTSFATPLVAGAIAARMSYTGENGRDAAAAVLAEARANAVFGVGAVVLP